MMDTCTRCQKVRPIFHGIGGFRLCRACWDVWRQEAQARFDRSPVWRRGLR